MWLMIQRVRRLKLISRKNLGIGIMITISLGFLVIHLEGTITAGEMIQVVSFLVAAFAVYNRLSIKIAKLETNLQTLYDWWQNRIECNKNDCPFLERGIVSRSHPVGE